MTNLPIDQIRQTVHPTADQEAGLDDLSAASSQASEVIKSSCPSSVPITPVRRLDAAEQRVDATIKGIQVVRSPFERFYQALNDEQRRQFNAMDGSTKGAHSAGNMAGVCSQQAGSFIDLPVQRIEQVIQPTAQQQSAFDNLKKATQNASDKLQSSCPSAVPLSPVARLDTVEARLEAMADAIKSVRPALENFYGSLNDEQKARFNMMGPTTERRVIATSEWRAVKTAEASTVQRPPWCKDLAGYGSRDTYQAGCSAGAWRIARISEHGIGAQASARFSETASPYLKPARDSDTPPVQSVRN